MSSSWLLDSHAFNVQAFEHAFRFKLPATPASWACPPAATMRLIGSRHGKDHKTDHRGEFPCGRTIRKTAPREWASEAESWPPWRSMIIRQIARPNPIPSGFVVTNASKTLSRLSASMPGPVSSTSTTIALSPSFAGSYRQHSTIIPACRHRLYRVLQQVDDDLLQLTTLADDMRHVGLQIGVH